MNSATKPLKGYYEPLDVAGITAEAVTTNTRGWRRFVATAPDREL
jgi:hypothetical protein